jgi:hypothetical protein
MVHDADPGGVTLILPDLPTFAYAFGAPCVLRTHGGRLVLGNLQTRVNAVLVSFTPFNTVAAWCS